MQHFGYPNSNFGSGTRGDYRVPDCPRYPTQSYHIYIHILFCLPINAKLCSEPTASCDGGAGSDVTTEGEKVVCFESTSGGGHLPSWL